MSVENVRPEPGLYWALTASHHARGESSSRLAYFCITQGARASIESEFYQDTKLHASKPANFFHELSGELTTRMKSCFRPSGISIVTVASPIGN